MASEGGNIVRRQWWFGVVAVLVPWLGVLLWGGASAARSLLMGALAILLGTVVAGLVTFRRRAPTATQAALGMVMATLLRWGVAGGVLVLAFQSDDARPAWIMAGVLIALLATTAAALTYKRQ